MENKSTREVSVKDYQVALVCLTRIENAVSACSEYNIKVDSLYKEIRDGDWTGPASDTFFSEYDEYNEQKYSSVLNNINVIKESIKTYIGIDEDINAYAMNLMDEDEFSLENITNYVKENFGFRLATEFFDYSVTEADLQAFTEIELSTGVKVPVYSSIGKNGALYVISEGLNYKEKAELAASLKGILSENQMAIITYNGDYYHYDISDRKGTTCTQNYALVGKNAQGLMFSFSPNEHTYIVTDGGGSNDTLLVSYNGFILGAQMDFTMESGAAVPLMVDVKQNVDGGQVVTEFTRLGFSNGEKKAVGNEHGTVVMENGMEIYANTKKNRENGTAIFENKSNNAATYTSVLVGDGPSDGKPKFRTVGHVDSTSIPITVTANDVPGDQYLQATVCYYFEGERRKYHSDSKDMCRYYEHNVPEWAAEYLEKYFQGK